MPAAETPRPRRRPVVLAVAGTALLTGCGIRLEDDAPRVPLVPVRTPLPAEDLLVRLVADSAALAGLAGDTDGPLPSALAALHRRQVTVVRTALLRGGMPPERLADPGPDGPRPSTSVQTPAAPAPTPSGSPSGTPAVPARRRLAAAEAVVLDDLAAVADVGEDLRGPVTTLHAQRWAAAVLLGGAPPVLVDDVVDAAPVARLAEAAGAARYFLEVAAARSSGSRRDRAARTLGTLDTLHADLSRDVPDGAVLGRPLPGPVETGRDVDRLVLDTLLALRATIGGAAAEVVSGDGATGVAGVVRWLGPVEVEVHRWGADLQPFPGLA
ncbi:hypothetical protein KC207_16495 [Phycicoccus sp. BSK3Z-2]|uniref:DUF4439 domain-containing protein n=1 Tax=Phycicoccus avicenniae TaxID=2828860 RepID=A0A941DAV9_9MICO|nr:hypothetical protein [Phycicoccus avicenniae]MBR7744895.1 hypothetical protein [Phycicoccus avicenniae]